MWYIILAAILIFFLLLITPVTIEISYLYKEKDNFLPDATLSDTAPGLRIRLSFLWGLIGFDLNDLSSNKLKSKKKFKKNFFPIQTHKKLTVLAVGAMLPQRQGVGLNLNRVVDLFKRNFELYHISSPATNYLLSKISLQGFSWCTWLGLNRPEQTGLGTGLLWALKSSTAAYFYSRIKGVKPKPQIQVIPIFHTSAFVSDFRVSFGIKLYQICAVHVLAGWRYISRS